MSNICFYPADIAHKLCVYAGSSSSALVAQQFARQLGLTFFSYATHPVPANLDFPYVFVFESSGAHIVQTGKNAPGPVSASFMQGKTTHRLKFGGGKGQMIAKAVGLHKGVLPSVLDTTAGLAQDAFVLASLGCRVQMLERSPVIAQLIRQALFEVRVLSEARETEIGEIIDRMELIEEDACFWLQRQSQTVADVIYLDPMYPTKDKSALVKKEMRLFHTLVGESGDDAALLASALEKARYRVVVKRPRKGEIIAGERPAHQIIGKSCRYDIYPLQRMENLKNETESV